jgi:hypothetical protein
MTEIPPFTLTLVIVIVSANLTTPTPFIRENSQHKEHNTVQMSTYDFVYSHLGFIYDAFISCTTRLRGISYFVLRAAIRYILATSV